MKRLAPFTLALILSTVPGASASDYTDYVEAKKEYLNEDRDYMAYVKEKQRLANERRAGLAEWKRLKAWQKWRAERQRLRFVAERDRKDRMPASVIEAEERENERQMAVLRAEIERGRAEHIRLRDIRLKAREEVETNPISDAVRARNEQPWNQ